MRSMTTTNPESGNPSNALERQVQSLTVVIEQLTQQNQELKQQMNLVNEYRAQNNDQHDKKHNDEHDDSHLLTGDQHEGGDQEESNVANMCNWWKDTDR